MGVMAAPRYREEFLLGTGGMAEVWLATGPVGRVAIKRLLPHAARNASLAGAFEREGRLLQRIRHPNVIGIHEVMRDEKGTSLILEYVEGADLHTLGRDPVPDRIALRVVRDVLRALEAVHGLCDDNGRPLGLIHRDLSPSNVLIGVDGIVKLTDFGIARAVRGTHATTGTDVKGTLAYLAPEQATGAPVDARTDLFAAGALLYEMLSGSPVYDDVDPRVALARARAGDVKSLSIVKPETPIAVVELVDRALAAAPTDRFPTASMMIDELESVAERTCGLATDEELAGWSRSLPMSLDRYEVATPVHAVTKTATWRKSSALASGVLLGALLGGVAWWVTRAPRRVDAVDARPSAAVVAVVAPAAQPAPPAVEPSASPVVAAAPAPAVRDGAGDRPTDRSQAAEKSRRAPASEPNPRPATEPKTPGKADETRESAAKSLLDIGSEPAFAYVTIDGVKVGATPLFGREVTPGTHRIEVTREGLGSKRFTIEVRPGDRISRVVKLP
jgi:serine/threonine-protein kinase